MHLILAIFTALVLFRWVCTKPARRRMSRPIEGTATIWVEIVRNDGPINIAEVQKLRP